MIINGNYKYFEIEKLKPLLIEAFVEYYGEEFRNDITYKINSFRYLPYHSHEFVNAYYDLYMYNLREKIADKFFEITGIENTIERKNLIIRKSPEHNPQIFLAVEGGIDIDKNNYYTDSGKRTAKRIRNKLIKEFGLSGSEEEIYQQINNLYNNLVQAEIEIEKENTCDVVEDMDRLEQNQKTALINLIKSAKNIGYDVSFNDIASITKDNFQLKDCYKLDCFRKLFGESLTLPGVLVAFTEKANERLKNGSESEKLSIVIDRLKYVRSLEVELEYITEDELYNPSDDCDIVKRILLEYEYQKKNVPAIIDYWGLNEEEVTANFRKGQFFPIDLAEQLEDLRKKFANTITNNCKCTANKPFYTGDMEFFTLMNYNNYNLTEPYSAIYILEDQIYDMQAFLDIIIHETNHAISHGLPIDLTANEYVAKAGLNVTKAKRSGLKTIKEFTYYNENLLKADENVCERQTKDILRIFNRKYKVDLGLNEDKIYKLKKEKHVCEYDAYNFLTEDLYNLYYEELKLQRVDDSYDIYKPHNFPTNRIEYILDYFKDKFSKNKSGVLDFQLISKLGQLIDEFERNIFPLIYNRYGLIDLRKEECINMLEPELQQSVRSLIKRKNKIMSALGRKCVDIECEQIK